MINYIMIAILTVTVVTSVVLGYLTLTRLQSKKREFFVLYLFFMFIYEFGYILQITAGTTEAGLTAMKAMYMGSLPATPAFLVFVQKYCEKSLGRFVNGLMLFLVVASIVLVWTSHLHPLHYASYWYNDTLDVPQLQVKIGILYPFVILFPVICTIVSVILLVQKMIASHGEKKKQMVIFIVGALTPLGFYIHYVTGIEQSGINFAPVFIMASMIILYFGVFKYDLLDNEESIRSQNWLKDMIGNISHDLKTPLTVLGQYLEILDDNTITMDEMERADYVHIAYNKNLNLQRLIRNLFEITRIESNQLVYNLEWQSAADLASELQDKYAKFLAGMGLSFSAISLKPCLIYLDRDKIWNVFNNIIFNAIRHTPRGGSISVLMQYSPGNTEAGANAAKSADGTSSGVCTITVTDTGEGIEQQHLPHIFERFYKVSQSRNTGDSGIGLYIAQTNIHNMGGNITVKSELNKGTAFIIALAAKEKG